MRIAIPLVALGAALAAAPALAQVDVGVGGQVGTQVGVGVDPGGAVDAVTRPVDRAVNQTDRTLNRTLDRDLRLATSADLTAGAVVRDNRGNRVGAVQSVHGSTAVVVEGGRTFHVPLAALYRGSKGLVTSLTRAQIEASARANARARIRN